jgi:hypothetical protein
MGKMRDDKDMPSTNGRREITARANAKEAETVRQAQKLTLKTKRTTASSNEQSQARAAKALKSRPREDTA